MKIYVPHPFHNPETVKQSNSGASLSGFNHIQALSKQCDIYMPATETTEYGPNLYGISQPFESIESSRQWFARQNFDGILMFEPKVDDLAFFRHVCPTPIVIRLSCCLGRNRDFMNDTLNCYSLLRPHDALSPKSEYGAKEIANLIFDPTYLHPITNGVNTETFKPSDKLQARKTIAEQTGDQRFLEQPVVGFCGRFEPAKGAYTFLRMADLNPNVLFVIIGKQFAPVTHPPNVLFLGAQPYDQMPLYYNALDILCSLSVYSYESCPSTVLEGMACGLPIIATNFAGAPELLGGCGKQIEIERFDNEPLNITGYIDPNHISNGVNELLESKTARVEMGKRARQNALNFSWDHTTQKLIKLFEHLSQKRDIPQCPLPITISFTQAGHPSGDVQSIPKAYNYFGSSPGPLPRIPFFSQALNSLEGLGLHLQKHLHPNEVEAALLGICGDRDTTHKTLRKIRQIGDMLTAP